MRRLLGRFPELNALEATPQGEGIGSQIIACAEGVARSMDQSLIGLAVERENVRARQLYERLGFRDWGDCDVVDRWNERDAFGVVVGDHADVCVYLIKPLDT